MKAIRLVALAVLWTGASFAAVPSGGGKVKKAELVFKTEEAKKAFEEAKKVFMQKKYDEARKLLSTARNGAKNRAAKEAVREYVTGLKGLKDLLLLERKIKSNGGWVYENAQRKYLVYYTNPAGKLFRELIAELEKEERKLVTKIENFETSGPYSVRFGKTFVNKVKDPQFVVEGEHSLRWECKNRKSLALKITRGPKDWSSYAYVGLWLYEAKGKGSELYVMVANRRPPSKRKVSRLVQRSFNGFQGKIPPHSGWKFVTLPLNSGKGLRRVGKGDLTNVDFIQFQLPTVRRFLAYFDNIVLVRKK